MEALLNCLVNNHVAGGAVNKGWNDMEQEVHSGALDNNEENKVPFEGLSYR
jgi:hypothetical protein